MKPWEALDAAAAEESWEYLEMVHPKLAEAVVTEAKRGATPGAIKRRWISKTSREELAIRLELAAEFLISEGQS